jgi:anti-sigma regulatory factor (Ser/Thr protein kinase)
MFSINEAATNALRHGDGHGVVRIWRDPEHVIAEVSSAGGVNDALAGRLRPGTDATSGWGLWLVNHLCDLVELRSAESGTVLRMRLRVDPVR